ncbi:MAG: organoarsenical effux MFS transporter ArsJ [Pseudohongiellaceae bacterium]
MIRNNPVAQYIVVTLSYWAFTLTDGALRMLVVLFFHDQGFSPLEIATLFILYELFGVITNLFGGWIATRIGLNMTMHAGLALQILALAMLLADPSILTVFYVMVTQALSGIAKDLNKMSAKSSIKMLVKDGADGALYRWVARLTGSKNALKGVGFFMGGALLAAFGFRGALLIMLAGLVVVLAGSICLLDRQLGTTAFRPKFRELLSKSPAINRLSAARFFLFSSRDVWFVVALPVFLQTQLGWDHVAVGTMMAGWVIGYGIIQAVAPRVTGSAPDGRTAFQWAAALCLLPFAIALALMSGWQVQNVVIGGLLLFGAVFAVNSSVHSYLIVSYARADGVSLDVGFYYMANAAGRLTGTVLSGLVYQFSGLAACLLLSGLFIAASSVLALRLPRAAGDAPS